VTFWAQLERAERERLDAWQDVEPALCSCCNTVKRGVLLGVCAACLEEHDGRRADIQRRGAA
jgi:hypothetical protein